MNYDHAHHADPYTRIVHGVGGAGWICVRQTYSELALVSAGSDLPARLLALWQSHDASTFVEVLCRHDKGEDAGATDGNM
jgi:hypothetical protein